MIDRARTALSSTRAPYLLLVLLCLASLALRAYRLDQPCADDCPDPAAATLIFDEAYYVNAARVIAGIDPPEGAPYAGSPAGHDPNAEHPQLAKLLVAAGIAVFGDDPLGWRIAPLLFGTLVLPLFFALVRSARGSPWLALGATAVLASDNLTFVHGRIATLDVFALVFVLATAVAYLRGRPVVAAVLLGLGMATKLVSFYVLFALGLLEILRWLRRRRQGSADDHSAPRRDPVKALAAVIVLAGVTYGAVLTAMDAAVPPYDPGTQQEVTGGAIGHTRHMLDTARKLSAPDGPQGAASYPWQWLIGEGTFDYAKVAANDLDANGQVVAEHDVIRFQGAVNPFLLLLAIPALFAAAASWWRRGEDVDLLAVTWFAGWFAAFCVQSLFGDRIMYVHYLLLVLPGIWLATARLFSPSRVGRAATLGWAVALVVGIVQLFPFRTLS